MRQITIKDIAADVGFSVSTVSRALNNHKDVHAKTKRRVAEAAAKLGYQPNIMARSLKAQQSNLIGVIVPEIKHDFFANAISGIEEIAYQKGFTVIVSQSNEDFERERFNLTSMYLNRVAGVIISISQSTRVTDHFSALLDKGVKMVFFDRVCEDLDVFRVVVDDFESSRNAVHHLISKGYRNIIHLAGPQSLAICRQRRMGFQRAMDDAGLNSTGNVLEGGMHESDGYASVDTLIRTGVLPDAIFAVNDPVAIGAFKRLKEAKIKIPDQVGIVGFSNNPITEMIEPSLTTVEQPSFEMGKEAARLLLNQLENREIRLKSETLTLATRLVIREST